MIDHASVICLAMIWLDLQANITLVCAVFSNTGNLLWPGEDTKLKDQVSGDMTAPLTLVRVELQQLSEAEHLLGTTPTQKQW